MHVLQRQSPELFKPLYETLFRFRAAKVIVHPWIDERQVTNPDGLSDDWVLQIPIPTETSSLSDQADAYWVGTILLEDKPLHAMGRDFVGIAAPLRKRPDNSFEMLVGEDGLPEFTRLNELTAVTSRLPIPAGYDHPNEVAAYLFTAITHGASSTPSTPEAAAVLEQASRWFKENLNQPQDTSGRGAQ